MAMPLKNMITISAAFRPCRCSQSPPFPDLLTLSSQWSSRQNSWRNPFGRGGHLEYVAAAGANHFGQAHPADQERLLAGAADHRRHGDGLLHPAAADDGGPAAQPHSARHRQHAEGAVAAHRLPCQCNGRCLARQAAGPGCRAEAGDRPSSRRITICCSSRPGPIRQSPARSDPKSIENVLFAKPFHLDYFSVGLIANGERLISSFESQLARRQGRLQGRRRARQSRRLRRQRDAVGLCRTWPAHQRLCRRAVGKAARSPPHPVLRHHRRHRAGGAVHLPADVERDPAQDA